MSAALVKICGVTRPADARAAADAGAWAVGAILSPVGPRAVDPGRAADVLAAAEGVERVGVFVSPSGAEVSVALERLPLTMIQVHGSAAAAAVVAREAGVPLVAAHAPRSPRELHAIRPPAGALTLLDARDPDELRAGARRALDRTLLVELRPSWPFLLAGGITPENVADVIAAIRPAGVDVSGGVESAPGVKDHAQVAALVARAREALAATG